MRLFLTSSPCDDDGAWGLGIPCIWDNRNGLCDQLRQSIHPDDRGVMIAAAPDAYDLNDEMRETFNSMFAQAGMALSSFTLVDRRNQQHLHDLLQSASAVLLGGGHVPTMLGFLSDLHLREELRTFNGLVLGISAGSMCSADTVYVQPEEAGESVSEFVRFRKGLGLTDINILPHYDRVKDHWLDQRRLIDDITAADSYGQHFYLIPDGSHILQENNRRFLCGEGYLMEDGQLKQICCHGETIEL